MNFQSAMQYSRESLHQWADRMYKSMPYPACALELRTKMLACMPLMVSPRLWRRLSMEYCTTSSRGGTDWLAQ